MGHGPELARDANGWIIRLETNCWAETSLLTGSQGHAPTGNYVCLYDGEGQIDFRFNAKIVSRVPGRIVVNIDSQFDDSTFLVLRSTNPTNYVRNIRVIMPGFETTYRTDPFYPPFLARWGEFNTFRFMDWVHINDGATQCEWPDRSTPNSCNFTERGVPIEVLVELCNRLKVNPWFCMPHPASDDYIRQFATLVRRTLDPALKVYVEYSNEVWNSMFEQHRYAEAKGIELNLGPSARLWECAALFYGRRSQEIFKIWEEAFGGRDRLVRVIAWQAAGDTYWVDGLVLGQNDTGKHAERLAGLVEVDETCIGGSQPGQRGRGAAGKSLVRIAAQADGRKVGRIRAVRIAAATAANLQDAIVRAVGPRAHIQTDGWLGYHGLSAVGDDHEVIRLSVEVGENLLPRVNRRASVRKRWRLSPTQAQYGRRIGIIIWTNPPFGSIAVRPARAGCYFIG